MAKKKRSTSTALLAQPLREAVREHTKRAIKAIDVHILDIDAELDALPKGVEIPSIIDALNRYQRQRPPEAGRKMHPLRSEWLLREARRILKQQPDLSIRSLADCLAEKLLAEEHLDAAPAGAMVEEWEADGQCLLANDCRALIRFLKRHIRRR